MFGQGGQRVVAVAGGLPERAQLLVPGAVVEVVNLIILAGVVERVDFITLSRVKGQIIPSNTDGTGRRHQRYKIDVRTRW